MERSNAFNLFVLIFVFSILRYTIAGYCTENYACYTASYRSTRIGYNACGFWGWSQCWKYGTRSYAKSETCYRRVCCIGYTGNSCHSPICSTSCKNGGTCVSPDKCLCRTGFSTPFCADINECNTNNGGCQHTCTNTYGSFRCSCNSGYSLSGNGNSCNDMNECNTNNGGCQHTCLNTHGSFRCACNSGYSLSGDGKSCNDTNECNTNNGGCQHTCTNTQGFFRCSCNSGYSLGTDGKSCNDRNECNTNNGGCQHKCININGSFRCSCNSGYSLIDGKSCNDINECSEGTHDCGQVCINVPGSFECSCQKGYELASDRNTCSDVNECNTNNGGCQHTCTNTHGSFRCACNSGYSLSSDGKSCNDRNECNTNNGGCQHTCININGSFRCSCNSGYSLLDGKSCNDINECLEGTHDCSHVCINVPGSFECSCNKGYELASDRNTCSDMNECNTNNGGCQHTCTNSHGSFRCSCISGYSLSGDGKSCNDRNECNTNNGGCQHTCINIHGSFRCSCNSGYSLIDGKSCNDINECLEGTHDCGQVCINVPGSFECSCNKGYELASDRNTCSDVNECKTNNGGCQHTCTNTHGSFRCSCNSGYSLSSDGKSCNDINECNTNNGGCQHTCINTHGSFRCSCNSGYSLSSDGKSCNDRNECNTNNGGCQHTCINSNGSFRCSCNSGYSLIDGKSCNDVNECLEGTHDCSQVCINVPGSFECSCHKGYELASDRNTCSDMNECNTNNGDCQHTCTNTHGSFRCSCNSGYLLSGDGKSCNDRNECNTNNGGCQHTCININGSFNCSCNSGFSLIDGKSCNDINECLEGTHDCGQVCINVPGSFECSCHKGYELASDRNTCSDINECLKGTHDCGQVCINVPGSFECSCNKGYELASDRKTCSVLCFGSRNCQNGGTCVGPNQCVCRTGYSEPRCTDINECASNNGGCQHRCLNIRGSFTCSCPRGYDLNTDRLTCTDIDECQRNSSGCSHNCTNHVGSFSCICREGFLSDGTECEDIDECLEGSHDCSQVCDNVHGSFECSCNKGYALASDRKTCSVFSYCATSENTCEQTCLDVPGSFTCKCRSGFTLNSDARTCSDIDECDDDTSGCSHSCTNYIGSFECACPPGYFLSDDKRSCIKEIECDQSLCKNGGTCMEHVLSYTCRCASGFTGHHCENDINECDVMNGGCQGTCRKTDGSFSCSCDGQATLGPDGFSCRGGTSQTDSVFERAKLARQLLPRGCHNHLLTSFDAINVYLSSTSPWYRSPLDESTFSSGIIFAEINDLALPVSLRGITVQNQGDDFTISLGVSDLSATGGTPIGMTRFDNCQSFELTPSDVYEFVSANSFQKTMFDRVFAVLPDFIQLTAVNSSILEVVNLKTDLLYGRDMDKMPWCAGAPLIDDNLYSAFRFDNNFELSFYGNTISIPKPLQDRKFCLIVDICHGNGGSVFFMIPEDSRDLLTNLDFFENIKNYAGLSIFPRGIGISLDSNILPEGFDSQQLFWNSDQFFTYRTFTRGDVWLGGKIHYETDLVNTIAEIDAFVSLPNPRKILTGIYIDEWNVMIHGRLSHPTLEFEVFGIKYNISFIDLEKTRLDVYSSFGGTGERKWCGDGSSTDIANPPGLFFSSIIVVNPFYDIPIIGEWIVSASARLYGYLTTDNLHAIDPTTTVSVVDDILQIQQTLDRIQTSVTDLLLMTNTSFVNDTSYQADYINSVVEETKTLLRLHTINITRGNINNLSNLLEQIWRQFVKIKKSVQIFYDAIEFIESDSKEAVINGFQSEQYLLKGYVDNAMRKFSRKVVSSVNTYSAFGVKAVMTLKVVGLIIGEADLEFSFSNDIVAKCSRFNEVYDLLKGEKALRILGRLSGEDRRLGFFLTAKRGLRLGAAFAMESEKWIIQLNTNINMLGISTTVDTIVSNKGIYLFVEGYVWDSFLAQIDMSAALRDDWCELTFSLKGRFVAKARHRRQTQSQSSSYKSSYLDALKKLTQKMADEAVKRLEYLQNDLTKAQGEVKRAQDWLEDKKENVRNANQVFDNAIAKLEDAKQTLEEAKGPFERALRQLSDAQRKIDNLCRIRICPKICFPGVKCDTCHKRTFIGKISYPCCNWTGCLISFPDPLCVVRNNICRGLRRAAYSALETAKISVKAPMLAIDVAKTVVSATNIIVDESRIVLNVATEAMNLAQGTLLFVNAALESAKYALEAVKYTIRGALKVVELIVDHGLKNILDARNCGFEITVSTTDPQVFGVTCEVNAFRLGWTTIGMRIDFRNPFQTIWQAAKATIEFLEESLKFDRRKREVIFELSAKVHKLLRKARQTQDNVTLEDVNDQFMDITNRTKGMDANISDSFDSRVKWFGDKCMAISRIQRFLLDSFGVLHNIANESKSRLELPTQFKETSEDFDFDGIMNSLTLEKAEINVEYGEMVYSLTRDDMESAFSDAKRTLQDDPVVQEVITAKKNINELTKEEIKNAERISLIDYWKAAMQNNTVDYFEDHECSGFGDCLFNAITNMYGLYEDEYDLPNITTIKDLVSELETHTISLISHNVTNVTDTFDLATLVYSIIHELDVLNMFCSEAPQFTTSFKNLTVFRGSNVQTQCRTTANPEATVWWYKDGELIPEQSEEHLTINGATEKDAGVYKCVAGNIVANITSPETTLFVVESDDTDMTARTKDVIIPVSLGVSGFLLFFIGMALAIYYWRTRTIRWSPKRTADDTVHFGHAELNLYDEPPDQVYHSIDDMKETSQ